jgi:RNA polymerase sigma-70 factor, ECF subfamily
MAVTSVSTPIDFRELYRRYHRLVWWVVRGAGVPEAWVEDVVHDAFLAIHRRLPELADPAQLRPRVIGIARNAAFSHRRGAARRRARQAAELAPEEPSAVDSIVGHRQAWDQVRRFLDELDEPQREAFVLCELQGMAPADVASALQVSRNTVYSRLRLARAKLLDHFS